MKAQVLLLPDSYVTVLPLMYPQAMTMSDLQTNTYQPVVKWNVCRAEVKQYRGQMMVGVWLLMDAAEDAKEEEAEGSMKKRGREQREEAVG